MFDYGHNFMYFGCWGKAGQGQGLPRDARGWLDGSKRLRAKDVVVLLSFGLWDWRSMMCRWVVGVFVCFLSAASFAQSVSGLVVYVDDGDTLVVLDADHRQHKIRLAEIDAPEVGHGRNKPGQPFGQAASKALSEMCFKRQASVEVIDTDRYGRSVGRVVCDGKDVNLILVQTGMAWNYRRYNRRAEITRAEDEARSAHRGLWADVKPVAPWDYRHGL